MRNFRSLALVSTLLAASLLTACDGHTGSFRHDSDSRRAAAQERQHDRLESRVMSALQSNYRIKSRKSLRVTSQGDGVVEIHGQIEGAEDKLQATETARRVPGVRQVINNMTY